jgi:ureidoglycolate lyase
VEAVASDPTIVVRDLSVRLISRDSFAPFGDLIPPIEDRVPFGPDDAKLDIVGGIPRLYIMRLPRRGLVVRQITRHRAVTQCLAAMGGKSWLLAVAPPKDLDSPTAEPALTDIVGFLVPGTVAVKLHRGTWHAGPFFDDEEISFLNLELSDTNKMDHQSSDLLQRFGCVLRFAA